MSIPNDPPMLNNISDLGTNVPIPSQVTKKGEPEVYNFLRSLPLFSKLPENQLRSLADSSRMAIVEPGKYITIEGDEKSLYGFK